ncbi:MAG: AraC family transcriptional regulator [Faecousia sp.]
MSLSHYEVPREVGGKIAGAAKLLYVSTARYGGDWHSTPHSHRHAELFYVVGGVGKFRIEDELYPVAADDLVVVNPLVQHTEVSLNANPLEYIVLGVEGLELSVQDSPEDRFCIVNFRDTSQSVLPLLQGMLQELQSRLPGCDAVCQGLLEVLVVRLMRRTDFSASLAPPQHASRESAAVRRYIDAHFKENLNLDTLAELVHVNKFHMAHAFTREYGVSPISYLNARRIEESAYLLKATDHPLARIAQMMGFSSPSYFSQSFRKAKGISPLEYRNQFSRNEQQESNDQEEKL